MPSYSARGLVLKKTKLGETDLIVTLFAETGQQIRAIAKGARRPGSKLGSHLELYSVVDLLLHTGKSLDIITEAKSWVTNEACRRDIEHSAAAAVVVELLDKVSRDNDVEARLFSLSLEALRCIGDVDRCGLELIAAAHILKTSAQLGYRPALDSCAVCGSSMTIKEGLQYPFSMLEGGIQCPSCRRSGYLDTTVIMDSVRIIWAKTLLQSRFRDLEQYCAPEYADVGVKMLYFAQDWLRAHSIAKLKSLDFLVNLDA